MKPVDQTRFGKPRGNCFAACVASILEIPLEEVDFDGSFDDWWGSLYGALRSVGWSYFEASVGDSWRSVIPRDVHFIAGGKNPNGVDHAVVYFNGELAHDPNPSRAGLAKVETIGFLIPLRPQLAGLVRLYEGEPGILTSTAIEW